MTIAYQYDLSGNKIEINQLANTVKCEICGRWMQQLSGHLQNVHRISVGAYKIKYPGASTVSPALHEVMIQCNKDKHATPGYSDMVGRKISAGLISGGGAEKLSKSKTLYHFNKRWNNIINPFIKGDLIRDFTTPIYWDDWDEKINIWRGEIFKRDNWICQACLDSKFGVQAHHILKKSEYPELAYDINNGITLCVDCHRETFGKEHHYIDFLSSKVV